MRKSIRMPTGVKWLKITMYPNEFQWLKRNKRLEIVTRTLNKMMIIQVQMKKMTRVNNMIGVKTNLEKSTRKNCTVPTNARINEGYGPNPLAQIGDRSILVSPILDDSPQVPNNNIVENNVGMNDTWVVINQNLNANLSYFAPLFAQKIIFLLQNLNNKFIK